MRHAGYFLTAVMALSLAGSGAAIAGQASPAKVDRSKGAVKIIYPLSAQKRGEEGHVVARVQVSDTGKPTGQFAILKSSGFDDLDSAALNSVLHWPYSPAFRANGESTGGWVTVKVTYKLPKSTGNNTQ